MQVQVGIGCLSLTGTLTDRPVGLIQPNLAPQAGQKIVTWSPNWDPCKYAKVTAVPAAVL